MGAITMMKSRHSSVAEVHPFDPTAEQIGGGVQFVKNFSEYLTRSGIRTTVIGVAAADGGPSIPATFKPVYRGRVSWSRFAIGLFLKLPRLVPDQDTLVHIHHPLSALPFMLWRRTNRILCTIHGQTLSHAFSGGTLTSAKSISFVSPLVLPVLIALERRALRRCDVVTAVGGGTASFLRERHRSIATRVIAINPGVN